MSTGTWKLLLLVGGCVVLTALGTGCNDTVSPHLAPPPVPSGVRSVTGDNFVDVYWNPINGVDNLAGYGVYRGSAVEGPYTKLASLSGGATGHYRDQTVQNGTTYYYAVDAFDREGNESALSVETVFDTPRPAGTGLRVFAREVDSLRSGINFSREPDASLMSTSWNDPSADVYVTRDSSNVLWVVGTEISGAWNDLQDLGGTNSLDDVGYAPEQGWSAAVPPAFELIGGHTYVLWTWDNHFVKFRVTDLGANDLVLDWAYQVAIGNPELARPVHVAGRRS